MVRLVTFFGVLGGIATLAEKSCDFLLGPDYGLFNSVYNKKKKLLQIMFFIMVVQVIYSFTKK